MQACALAKPGAKWVMTHPNGSHVEGYVVKPEDMDDYAHYRDIGVYCPFPEGVWSSIRARDAEGVGIINEIGVIWARHIGVPCPFKQPVKVFIEKGYIKKFEGGEEAETLTRFYQFISKYLGEAAYEVRGFHGGVHPSAILEPHQCPNAPYRHFIEHHHWSSFHFHMGNSRRSKTFPYLMHISAELRGGDLKIGENYVYKDGRITTADHPKVRAIAEKYKDRPGLSRSVGCRRRVREGVEKLCAAAGFWLIRGGSPRLAFCIDSFIRKPSDGGISHVPDLSLFFGRQPFRMFARNLDPSHPGKVPRPRTSPNQAG